jgi:4-hydroxyphenylpyruvate dioxygenase
LSIPYYNLKVWTASLIVVDCEGFLTEFVGMLTSIATVSISGTLDRKLAAIAEAGYQGVEIFENDLLGFDGTAADVGRMIADFGLICTCYQPFRDFEGLTRNLRQRAFDRAECKFDVMQALGAPLMLVCSSVHPEALGEPERLVEDFRCLAERAASRGLRIGYEALAWGRFVNDHRQAWDIVRRVDHSAVGLILDSFHSLARKIPIASLADIAPEKIFLVQVADAPDMPMEYLYWSRHFRCFPSQGDLPVAEYVKEAVRQGYDGPLSLEIFNDRFRGWSATQVAVDGLRSLTTLYGQVGITPDVAPRVAILGIDFIEFAVHADEAPALATLLTGLGFVHVGEHRSKNVSLWRQGEVHLVINRDSVGWAHSHWQIHGPSVCALALRVDDVQAALARARALNMATFQQQMTEGELAIPWIRGVGGALTYFTESDRGNGHWTNDFKPIGAAALTPRAEARPRAIARIDHLSQTMRMEEFLSWQLYYTSLFDLTKMPPVEIADTLGMVQSQAIESPDGSFRVTLNGSTASQTLAARFVEGEMGAGVQHIACQTDDIFEAVRALTSLGLEILPVPPNYYDDLRARFGLSEAFTAGLKESNVFYDRDASGEYFQFFSRAFDKRFFFEIVERRGYTGYGAANSGVRLAAQARYKQLRFD